MSNRLLRKALVEEIAARVRSSFLPSHWAAFLDKVPWSATEAQGLRGSALLGKPIEQSAIEGSSSWLKEVVEASRAGKFLLGARGWVELGYGAPPPGCLGVVKSVSPKDIILSKVASRTVSMSGQRARVAWNRDPLTGYEWPSDAPSGRIALAPAPGVDVRAGWEVARLIHLPGAALGSVMLSNSPGTSSSGTSSDVSGNPHTSDGARKFIELLEDFLEANPPGWGIHWVSGMEVAIRMANVALAFALFDSPDAGFDDSDRALVARFLVEHLAFSCAHPDKRRVLVHNHYLVQLAGEALGASLLVGLDGDLGLWADSQLGRISRALIDQVLAQLNDDGANFEGSVGYHAFALQAATFGLAAVHRRAYSSIGRGASEPWPSFWARIRWDLYGAKQRLARAATFLDAVIGTDGSLMEVGDHDDSRFVALEPPERWAEGVLGAVSALIERAPVHGPPAPMGLQAAVVTSMTCPYQPEISPHPGRSGISTSPDRSDISISPHRSDFAASRDRSDTPVSSDRFDLSGEASRSSPFRGRLESASTEKLASSMTVSDAKEGEKLAGGKLAEWLIERWERTAPQKRRVWVFGAECDPLFFGRSSIRGHLRVPASDLMDAVLSGEPPSYVYRFGSVGIYVLRDRGLHLVFRCGPIGQRGWGGHSHSDQLSIVLEVGGRRMLDDPGTPTYLANPDLRWAYRSGRAHNGPRAPRTESLPRTRSVFASPFAARGTAELVCPWGFGGEWRSGGSTFYRTVLASTARREVYSLLDIPVSHADVAAEDSVPWVVLVFDWLEGSGELAEPARFVPARFFGVLGKK